MRKKMRYPEKLEIEIVRGICTASCPMCSIEETTYNKKIMNLDMFKEIVDSFGNNLTKIKHVNLVGLGEVLVDKNLCDKIKYLKSRHIKHVSFPSNANPLSKDMAINLLEAGLDEIIFGLLIIFFLLFEPLGLYGMWIKVRNYWKGWPFSY